MKVIDLFVKITNGEKIPEKIRYCSDLYEIDYRYMDYKNKYINDTYLLRDVISSSEELCNKIEVVEEVLEDTPKEDNKISKVDITGLTYDGIIIKFAGKINEIIDRLNGE